MRASAICQRPLADGRSSLRRPTCRRGRLGTRPGVVSQLSATSTDDRSAISRRAAEVLERWLSRRTCDRATHLRHPRGVEKHSRASREAAPASGREEHRRVLRTRAAARLIDRGRRVAQEMPDTAGRSGARSEVIVHTAITPARTVRLAATTTWLDRMVRSYGLQGGVISSTPPPIRRRPTGSRRARRRSPSSTARMKSSADSAPRTVAARGTHRDIVALESASTSSSSASPGTRKHDRRKLPALPLPLRRPLSRAPKLS